MVAETLRDTIRIPQTLCPSIAIDYNGTLHLAYDANDTVFYAFKRANDTSWTRIPVSHPGEPARNPSLDVYGNLVHITWEDRGVYYQRWGYVDLPGSFLDEDTVAPNPVRGSYPFTRKGAGLCWQAWGGPGKIPRPIGVDLARYSFTRDIWETDSLRFGIGTPASYPTFESYWDRSKAFDWLGWTGSSLSYLGAPGTVVPPGSTLPGWFFFDSRLYQRDLSDVPAFYTLYLGTPNPTPYTRERDTFMVYENGIRVDYDADKLVYRFPFMEARSELMLILDLYYEGTEPQRTVRVEVGNDNLGDYPYSSGQKTRLTIELPDWVSGSEDVRITLKNQIGEAVEAAGLMIMAYAKKEGQGGPASLPGDMTPPFALYAPYPNPAKGKMTIQFSVPSGANTSLVLYDITGRRVSNLYQGNEPGLHILTWDGTGDNGSSLPAGVYFLRLTHGSGRSAVRKIIWMR